jgi:hypothetical protein
MKLYLPTANRRDVCTSMYVCVYVTYEYLYLCITTVSLLISPLLRHGPSSEPRAGWWVLTTAKAAGTNGLTCLPKHEEARDNNFLVTPPMTDQRCLTSAIARRSTLTAGPKGLTAFIPEIDCNQTVIGIPPVTAAVFLITKSLTL